MTEILSSYQGDEKFKKPGNILTRPVSGHFMPEVVEYDVDQPADLGTGLRDADLPVFLRFFNVEF